ncbi:MAG: sensor histidine kinase, partial [Paracoccus sp. (in: a-proteobacteria)]|nr:sensor histidine kinase [Paracoccus sp. (in: a-proteobacteria)]
KEVHHRVKNNLQLIASIISMQGRVIEDDDAKRVLRSVQDRVAAVASIYKNLYQAEHLDSVQADRLMSEIINQMTRATVSPDRHIDIHTELAPLILQPDQAVPLTLLTTEAFTNALKYAGTPPGAERPWVRVHLTRESDETARLTVANSIGAEIPNMEGTGLGNQLIEAFAMQLETRAVITTTDHDFTISMVFHTDEIRPLPEEDRTVVLTSAAREGARH